MAGSEQAQQNNGIFLFLGLVTVLSALMWALIFAPTPFKGGGGSVA